MPEFVHDGQRVGLNPARPSRIPGPETIPWYWHPFRAGVRFGPDSFRAQLHQFDPNLEITWNPIRERWQLWMRKPALQNKLCWGWTLLFVLDRDGEYLPPDNRVFARLYEASADKWGDGKKYFDHIQRQWEEERAKAESKWQQDTIDSMMPSWDYSQIKVAMRGKSNGSKFSTYFA